MKKKLGASLLVCGLMSAAAASAQEVKDPLEAVNRKVFAFNEYCDKYVLKPVAEGYQWLTPEFVDRSVTNVFGNVGDVVVLLNNVLQLKFHNAAVDFARVMFNTTFGIGGLMDVATAAGLEKHQEDFGQTLGHWGMGSGAYVVLPFLGPSTVRDAAGLVPDSAVYPIGFIGDVPVRNSLTGLRTVDVRADLIKAESLISGDKYAFMRDAYLQRRESLVQDGKVVDDFGDENWEEE